MPHPDRLAPSALSRRSALGALARAAVAALVAPALVPGAARAAVAPRRADVTHPEPRPGVTAERVLADAVVPRQHRDAYQAAREIPEVLDGIFCYCYCEEHRGLRSLLACFETDMPQSCGVCKSSALLAKRMHAEGEDLAAIRAAVDRRYGDRTPPPAGVKHDHHETRPAPPPGR
jgi:hypothetical protein